MGRIMSFGQDGRMVRDFDKSEHDFMRRYGKTPEEVMVENDKLRELMYERAHVYAIQNMTEDELRITATNVMEDNAKLRELCTDLYVLCYEHEVGWKLVDSTWEKYEPCDLCKERHGGKSPCASTSRDMSEECCDPYQAELFAKCMAALGIEVPS